MKRSPLALPTRSPIHRPGERGVTIFWFALFLLLSLGFIALGIDVAKLAATRTQLQNAADAAALAGASAVNYTTGHLDYNTTLARAQETGGLNKAFVLNPEYVIVDPSQVVLVDPNTVKVTVSRTGGSSIIAHFAQVLGIPKLEIHALAVARAETSSAVQCLLPIGVVLVAGEVFTPGCANIYTLKLGPGTGTRGNYGYVELPECPGSSCHKPPGDPLQIACLIEEGYCCGLSVGDVLTTEPGTKTPAIDGIEARFKNDTDSREGICYSEYRGNGERVVTVPVLSSLPSGTGNTTVVGFASFFMQQKPDKSNGELDGEFIYISTSGTGGGTPAGGAVTYSAHLIR